jgi:hypothetical protein
MCGGNRGGGAAKRMDVDDDLARKMRSYAAREAEIAREKQELQLVARQKIGQLDARIDELRSELDEREAEREELARFIGLPSSADHARLAHGALKEMCIEAMRESGGPLRSSEIKDWIEKRYPGTRTASVPATLSRQVEYGVLVRDELGRYRLK